LEEEFVKKDDKENISSKKRKLEEEFVSSKRRKLGNGKTEEVIGNKRYNSSEKNKTKRVSLENKNAILKRKSDVKLTVLKVKEKLRKISSTECTPVKSLEISNQRITPPQVNSNSKWNKEQLESFKKALNTVLPNTPLYWKEVADRVPGKTWLDCFHFHTNHAPKNQNSKTKRKKIDSPLTLKSNFNTAKSRRKARHLLSHYSYTPFEDAFDDEEIKEEMGVKEFDSESSDSVDDKLGKLLNDKKVIVSPKSNPDDTTFDKDKVDNMIARFSRNIKRNKKQNLKKKQTNPILKAKKQRKNS